MYNNNEEIQNMSKKNSKIAAKRNSYSNERKKLNKIGK